MFSSVHTMVDLRAFYDIYRPCLGAPSAVLLSREVLPVQKTLVEITFPPKLPREICVNGWTGWFTGGCYSDGGWVLDGVTKKMAEQYAPEQLANGLLKVEMSVSM
jgi:hypothetical protein